MEKAKRILIIFTIISCVSFPCFAVDEDLEELDYVWLEEEINKAKQAEQIKINSRYAVVYDRTSKTIIWGKDEDREVPMASTTKIMTAIVTLENITNLQEQIIVCKKAASIGGSRLGLKANDKITYQDLLYGLLLCSGNDAATQIAISVGGSVEGFAEMMNNKAKEIGLEHSNFVTPHGLDSSNHYTTAYELAIMADYALNIKEFAKIVGTKNYTVTINGYPKNISNTNELLGYLEGVNGVKTGFTNGAGRCLVTSVSRNGFDIIVVVLGADTKKFRTSDSIKLIEYTYKNYELVDLEQIVKDEFEEWKKINEKRINIYKGLQPKVKTILGNLKYKLYPIAKDKINDIWIDINFKDYFEAPVEARTKIGKMTVGIDGTAIMEVEILNQNRIERKGLANYFIELISKYCQWGRFFLTIVLRNVNQGKI